MLQIEAYMDVLCGFSFILWNRLKAYREKHPDIKIKHRAFALSMDEKSYLRGFGTKDHAKAFFIDHVREAKRHEERINLEALEKESFLLPTSGVLLRACKAAKALGGEASYEALFDALQEAIFLEGLNLTEQEVLEEQVLKVGLDLEEWREAFQRETTLQDVIVDVKIAKSYGIRTSPTLIINGEYLLMGAVSEDDLEATLDDISSQV